MTFEERVARCLALGAHPELLDVFTIREIERLSFLRWCVQRGIVQEQRVTSRAALPLRVMRAH